MSSLCLLTLCIFLNDAISFGLHSILFVLYSTGLTQGGCCLERNRCCWLRGGEDGLALEAITLALTLTHCRPSAPLSACKTGTIIFTWLLEEVGERINHLGQKALLYQVALQVQRVGGEVHYKCSYYEHISGGPCSCAFGPPLVHDTNTDGEAQGRSEASPLSEV